MSEKKLGTMATIGLVLLASMVLGPIALMALGHLSLLFSSSFLGAAILGSTGLALLPRLISGVKQARNYLSREPRDTLERRITALEKGLPANSQKLPNAQGIEPTATPALSASNGLEEEVSQVREPSLERPGEVPEPTRVVRTPGTDPLPVQTEHHTPGQQEVVEHQTNARGRMPPDLRIATNFEPPMQQLQPAVQPRPFSQDMDAQSPQRRFSAQDAMSPVSPIEREWPLPPQHRDDLGRTEGEWPLPPQHRDGLGRTDGSISSPDVWLEEDRSIVQQRSDSPRPKDGDEQQGVTRTASVHSIRR